MKGSRRDTWWDDTGLHFTNPSPNLARFETAIVYPCMCLFEGTEISEGRGKSAPFEVFGAPWLDGFKIKAEPCGSALQFPSESEA